ncbi:hypothetical protein O8C76_12330, partial [Aliarcobacter butzleri]
LPSALTHTFTGSGVSVISIVAFVLSTVKLSNVGAVVSPAFATTSTDVAPNSLISPSAHTSSPCADNGTSTDVVPAVIVTIEPSFNVTFISWSNA